MVPTRLDKRQGSGHVLAAGMTPATKIAAEQLHLARPLLACVTRRPWRLTTLDAVTHARSRGRDGDGISKVGMHSLS